MGLRGKVVACDEPQFYESIRFAVKFEIIGFPASIPMVLEHACVLKCAQMPGS